jgi:hypothetical protein
VVSEKCNCCGCNTSDSLGEFKFLGHSVIRAFGHSVIRGFVVSGFIRGNENEMEMEMEMKMNETKSEPEHSF